MTETSNDNTITATLEDFNAGVYLKQAGEALRQVALGVINHGNKGKKGKLVLTVSLARADDPDKPALVNVEHTWAFEHPTKRGRKAENHTTETPMYVARDGQVALLPRDQADWLGKVQPIRTQEG